MKLSRPSHKLALTMIPFTVDQFLNVFERYNVAVWTGSAGKVPDNSPQTVIDVVRRNLIQTP
jgi:hypothetical protein